MCVGFGWHTFLFSGDFMEIAILDGDRPFNKDELKKVVIGLMNLKPNPSFVMTCNNKTAIEAMKEVKNEYSKLSFFIFNWHKEFDKAFSKHYIRMKKCDKYPDGLLVCLYNEHFMENSDLLIRQGKERITVFYHPCQKDYIATLIDP